jgi:hypothetical protein
MDQTRLANTTAEELDCLIEKATPSGSTDEGAMLTIYSEGHASHDPSHEFLKRGSDRRWSRATGGWSPSWRCTRAGPPIPQRCRAITSPLVSALLPRPVCSALRSPA